MVKSKQQSNVPHSELLLPFEQKVFRLEWKSYFEVKRQNWLASIEGFRSLWDLFAQLDEIFHRGLTNCANLRDIDNFIPLLLFIKSHRSIRIVAEIAFATHITEAADLTRSAIECAAIAHKIHREPDMAVVWSCKTDGKAESVSYSNAFEKNKKLNLFPDSYPFLAQLHQQYSFFSEFGTHTTIQSLALQYQEAASDTHYKGSVKYVEPDSATIAKFINLLMNVFWLIENAFYDAFSARLSLDYSLEQLRSKFADDKESVRISLVKRFGATI